MPSVVPLPLQEDDESSPRTSNYTLLTTTWRRDWSALMLATFPAKSVMSFLRSSRVVSPMA